MGLSPQRIEYLMRLAVEEAQRSMRAGHGGPFGACVIRGDELIAVGTNTVIRDNDPTAHAEVNAIRAACAKLGTFWLEGCCLLATAEPCPMCMSAIYWARIEKVYFGCRRQEAAKIGFADEDIYRELEKNLPDRRVQFVPDVAADACRELMKSYLTLPDRRKY